jgi:multidrug transporter EmrE-like cation transporter
MPWILLSAAILLEVAGITSMKLSRGFAEPIPSAAVPVFYVLSAAAVILALKRLDLSVTYAVWLGVGTAHAATKASSISVSRLPCSRSPRCCWWCTAWSGCRWPASRCTDGGAFPR